MTRKEFIPHAIRTIQGPKCHAEVLLTTIEKKHIAVPLRNDILSTKYSCQ